MSATAFVPVIEGFWIRNFKVLKQIAVGSSFQQSMVIDGGTDLGPYELTPLTTFIGPSGSGKTTLLDAFAFLSDCLLSGADEAVSKRGGFDEIYCRNGNGPISVGIVYRACAEPRPLTYAVSINKKPNSTGVFVETEAIVYRSNYSATPTQPILLFQNGDKNIRHVLPWNGVKLMDIEAIKRTDNRHLALTELGKFDDLPDVPQLKRHLEDFHFSCYTPDNATGLIPALVKQPRKDSLHAEFKRMKERHKFEFPNILDVIAGRMPDIEKITYDVTDSGRIILRFKKTGEKKPYYAHEIGEGVLRQFSHFLLLEDPMPVPLIGIEEPAAYMDEAQVESFAVRLRNYVNEIGGSQFLITTNQISLIDQFDPTEVWMLYRDTGGDIKTERALDELSFRGVDMNKVGPYWYSDYIYRNKTEQNQ
ncbi:MAG: AAA family ATPase [Planctomycetaceae bacterium]|jgi:predicted ATPase|nr:AAA family ATPase [Planctomycetaceae bacterium]